MMGTPSFMPPEQALGEWSSVDARSDLWAVGATLFCMLSGRPVHVGETLNKVLLSAMSHRAPSLTTVVPDVPAAVAEVIDRALLRDPDQRWPDAHAMQAALRAARAVAVPMRSSVPRAPGQTRDVTLVSAVAAPEPPAFRASPSLLGTAVTASERRRSANAKLLALLGAALSLAAVVGGGALFLRRAADTGAAAGAFGAMAPAPDAADAPAASPVRSTTDDAPGAVANAVPSATASSAAAASAFPSSVPSASASASASVPTPTAAASSAPPRKGGAPKPRREYGF
jgi:serine/threonine-protein kinase